MFRIRILLPLLALTICTGMANATNVLVATLTSGANLACNTNTGGSGSAKVTIALTPAAQTAHDTVTVAIAGVTANGNTLAQNGLAASAGSTTTISGTTTVAFTITALAGCAGAANLPSGLSETYAPTLQFTSNVSGGSGVGNDITQALSVAVTAPATSPLAASPSAGITIPCTKNANGTYTPGTANFFVTTNTTTAGVPVTIDPAMPTWVASVALTNGGSNIANLGTNLEYTATAQNCSGNVGSYKSGTLKLQNLPAYAEASLPVTLLIVGPAQLSLGAVTSNASPAGAGTSGSPMMIDYSKNPATQPQGTIVVTAANSVYFTVDTTSLPNWLTVNFTSCLTNPAPGCTLIFTVTPVANSFTPGNYPIHVNLNVSGYASTPVYITLVVQGSSSSLSVVEGQARHLSWSMGQLLPTATITALSSGSPIPYTVTITTGSPDAGAIASPMNGLAFSSGSPINITFNPLAFAAATPGSTLSSTVTLNWSLGGVGQTTAVVFTVGIQAPSTTAVLTGINPTNLPSGTAGETFQVTLYGSGFVSSTLNTQKTYVGIVNPVSSAFAADNNIAVQIVNASTILLTITVPASDTALPFTTPGSTVLFGVCNPNGVAPPCAATSTLGLQIDAGPIIQSVTSASTFATVTQGSGVLAPYDIITLFGSNFCTSGGTGCTNGQVLYPTISASDVYGLSVTPDAGQRLLQVWIYPKGTTSGGWAAPLLFATNNQINAVVPNEIVAASQYDIYVKFGTVSSTPAYTFTAAATDAGVFVVDSNGNGAIEIAAGPNMGLVTNQNDGSLLHPARLRNSASNSDWVSIYMTGLGTPNSTGSNATTSGTSIAYTDCLNPATATGYSGAAGLGNTLPDGAIIQSSIITAGMLAPCFPISGTPYVAVTVGGVAATLKYVGWANDAIAGLYQVNVQLPGSGVTTMRDISGTIVNPITGAVQVPVVVTPASGTVAPTVNMWVQPAMTLSAAATPGPGIYLVSNAAITSGLPSAYALDTVTAAQNTGTGPAYAVVSITGPQTTGIAVDAASGAVTIPAVLPVGTYSVVITATDAGGGTLPAEFLTLTITVSS
ncbi:putative Ig family protein [Candidatus Sulfopaludibacter sp. SbA4]|nr:putative Ig family protein [Candidatus Sulfopaludibacter sp. SbA4]